MAKFKLQNLPAGFDFPITQREVRQFLQATEANFEIIEFGGLSSSESYYNQKHRILWNWACYLEAEYRESEWIFSLKISGLRVEHFQERREEIAQALLAQIRKWADAKLALPKTAPKKPCRAHAYFDLTEAPGKIAVLSEWS